MPTSTRGRKPKPKKPNMSFDQKDQIRIQVNSKTWVYVKLDASKKEIEELKKRYAPKFQ
jgi:hypothetical protein